MKIFLLCLLLLTHSIAGQSIQDQVNKFEKPKEYEVEFDKFEKVTTVKVTVPLVSSKQPSFVMDMHCYVRLREAGNPTYFVIFTPATGVRVSRYRNLYNRDPLKFLVDDELVEAGETDIDYTAGVHISPAHWNKIVAGSNVELQLAHSFEAKLDTKALQKMRNLASLTKPLPHPR